MRRCWPPAARGEIEQAGRLMELHIRDAGRSLIEFMRRQAAKLSSPAL